MSDNTVLMISPDSGTQSVHAGGKAQWDLEIAAGAPEGEVFFDVDASDPKSGPEWTVTLFDSTGSIIWDNFRNKDAAKIAFPGKHAKQVRLVIECPKGARYAAHVAIRMRLSSSVGTMYGTFCVDASQSIMVLKTKLDQEKTVVMDLIKKADKGDKDIFAILSPVGMRGYVYVEGMNTDSMHEKTRDIAKAGRFLDGEVTIEEISHYLTPVSAVTGIEEGDVVELINGPFKGESARVTNVDETKEEITVELIDAMVPIPVTVKADSVRLLEKEN